MNIDEIQNTILANLYLQYFDKGGNSNLYELSEEFDIEDIKYENLLSKMEHEGLIRPRTLGGNYQITPDGILWSEKQGFLPSDLVSQNAAIRTKLLLSLAEVYETKGLHSALIYEPLALEEKIESYQLVMNLQILEYFGCAEMVAFGTARITNTGMAAVEKYREEVALADRLEIIRAMEPHSRGRAFQSLIATIALREGWEKEESVKTSNEEMDVIIDKGREFYLIECKWEKDPVEAAAIRELFGKLGNRVDVKGIFVSMSGFSKGAIEQVISYANQKMILLYGPKDVAKLVDQNHQFDILLDQKYKMYVTRQVVMVDA